MLLLIVMPKGKLTQTHRTSCHLLFNSPLKQLDISNNSIGKEGAAALAAVLPSR